MAKKLMNLARWSAFAFLLCLWQPCFGQFNSSVEGTVSDPSGAVVPGARVTLHNVATNIDLTGTTESAGLYRFNGIGPGDYQVIVVTKGFAQKTISVHVNQDQAAAVNVSLALSGATAVVNVSGVADQLDPDETRVQETLESEKINNLPLQNGNVLAAVKDAPGVTGIDEDRALSGIGIGGASYDAGANGKSGGNNAYQLDGIDILYNNGAGYGATTNNGGYSGPPASLNFAPTPDMISEVAIEVHSYSVDYGGSTSMRVNFTTKGGSNKFHGTFNDRYSGRGLNATADFAAPALPNSRRWYSGTIGGPIFKDKTFFFYSFLTQTQYSALSGIQHWATNDFTQTWAPAHYPEPADNATAAISHGENVANLLVPFGTGPATGGQQANTYKQGVTAYARDLFQVNDPQGNPIPNDCAVPIKNAAFYLGSQIGSNPIDCSLEVVDFGNLNQTPRVNGYQMNGRIDENLRGGKDRFYGAYVIQPQVSDFIWWRPGFNSTTPGGTRYVNFNYSHIFNDHLVAQTTASVKREYGSFNGSPANVLPFLSLTLNAGNDSTDYFGTPGSPTWTKGHTVQAREDVNYTHNRHNVKAGFRFADVNYYDNQAGWLSKPETVLYFGWSDLLDDHPWSYSIDTQSGKTGKFLANNTGSQTKEISLYAQDDWKVKPNLLVTFGLRWDDYGNPSAYGDQTLPFENMSVVAGQSLRSNVINNTVSTVAVSNSWSKASDTNFEPRVGIAWTPSTKHRIVIHGGVGLYQDALNLPAINGALPLDSPSYLNLSYSGANPAPFNNVDARALYGVSGVKDAPFGRTYTYPTITPIGVDAHGEVEQSPTSVYVSAITALDPKLKPQSTALYNLQVEKELSNNLIIGVGYSGSFSWNQYGSGDYNSYPGDMIANNGNEVRLSPEWASIGYLTTMYTTNYNSLTLLARQNYHRLSWQASYTKARNMGYGQLVNDIYDADHYYGPEGIQVANSANGSVSYELPGRGIHNFIERAILAGWNISGNFTAQSGNPYSINTSANFVPISKALVAEGGPCVITPPATTCAVGTDILNPRNAGVYLANGSANSLVNLPPGIKTKGFNRAQFKAGIFSQYGYTYASNPPIVAGAIVNPANTFTNPAAYGVNPVYSNQSLNTFIGPGYLGVDSALHKKVLLPWFGKEGQSILTFGIEGTNVINRVNLTGPASTDLNTTSSNTFGVSTGAYQARIFQVIGRFEF